MSRSPHLFALALCAGLALANAGRLSLLPGVGLALVAVAVASASERSRRPLPLAIAVMRPTSAVTVA